MGSQIGEKDPNLGKSFGGTEKIHGDNSKAQGNKCAAEEAHSEKRGAGWSAR